MCVLDLGNFVVIILEYTTNAGACHVPSVCHCIDDESTGGRGRGRGGSAREREALLRLFFWQPLHGIGFGFYPNRITDKQCQQQF